MDIVTDAHVSQRVSLRLSTIPYIFDHVAFASSGNLIAAKLPFFCRCSAAPPPQYRALGKFEGTNSLPRNRITSVTGAQRQPTKRQHTLRRASLFLNIEPSQPSLLELPQYSPTTVHPLAYNMSTFGHHFRVTTYAGPLSSRISVVSVR